MRLRSILMSFFVFVYVRVSMNDNDFQMMEIEKIRFGFRNATNPMIGQLKRRKASQAIVLVQNDKTMRSSLCWMHYYRRFGAYAAFRFFFQSLFLPLQDNGQTVNKNGLLHKSFAIGPQKTECKWYNWKWNFCLRLNPTADLSKYLPYIHHTHTLTSSRIEWAVVSL